MRYEGQNPRFRTTGLTMAFRCRMLRVYCWCFVPLGSRSRSRSRIIHNPLIVDNTEIPHDLQIHFP